MGCKETTDEKLLSVSYTFTLCEPILVCKPLKQNYEYEFSCKTLISIQVFFKGLNQTISFNYRYFDINV